MSRIRKTNPLIWFTASNFHLAVLKKKVFTVTIPQATKFQLPWYKREASVTVP